MKEESCRAPSQFRRDLPRCLLLSKALSLYGGPHIHGPGVSHRIKKMTSWTAHHIPVHFESDEFQVTHTHICPSQECASLKALTSAPWFRHVRHFSLRCSSMHDLERLLLQLSGKLNEKMVLAIKFTKASEWATGDPWVRKKALRHVQQLLSNKGMQRLTTVICNEGDSCCIVAGRETKLSSFSPAQNLGAKQDC